MTELKEELKKAQEKCEEKGKCGGRGKSKGRATQPNQEFPMNCGVKIFVFNSCFNHVVSSKRV